MINPAAPGIGVPCFQRQYRESHPGWRSIPVDVYKRQTKEKGGVAMRSKRGSTLLLTICLFMVFLIFAAALIPLSRRAFQQTAADVTQQQADYIAKSAVEALITQLDEESLRQTLIGVVEGSKDQVVSD